MYYIIKKKNEDSEAFNDAEKKDIPVITIYKTKRPFAEVHWDCITLSPGRRQVIHNNREEINFEIRKILELKQFIHMSSKSSTFVGWTKIPLTRDFKNAENLAEDLFNIFMNYLNPKQPEDHIVGKWFLSFHENGKVKWQGQVLSKAPENHFMIQLYEWFSGSPSNQLLVKFSDMTNWYFYPSNKDMIDAYQRFKDKGLA